MFLINELETARHLFEKLQRDAALLEEEICSDRFFNFVLTGYSLIDWIKNDPSLPTTARSDTGTLYSNPWLRICGDLATSAKHFVLSTRIPVTTSATAERGFGQGRWGKGGWGVGEESITICLNDGTTYSVGIFVPSVVSAWKSFFEKHRL